MANWHNVFASKSNNSIDVIPEWNVIFDKAALKKSTNNSTKIGIEIFFKQFLNYKRKYTICRYYSGTLWSEVLFFLPGKATSAKSLMLQFSTKVYIPQNSAAMLQEGHELDWSPNCASLKRLSKNVPCGAEKVCITFSTMLLDVVVVVGSETFIAYPFLLLGRILYNNVEWTKVAP